MSYKEEQKQEHTLTEESQLINLESCEDCHGSGMIGDTECSSCNGRGVI